MTGANPRGAQTEAQAALRVREMFSRVVPRYDLANHLLSFNIDRIWRNRTADRVADILRVADARIVDLCCGTGDLTETLQRRRGSAVIGSDFCHPMLTAAAAKSANPLFEADALSLPVADGSLDLITCSFGFRNLANYDAGLREFRRVLRPGGRLAILEFSHPPNRLFARLYQVYSQYVLPHLGGWISGAPDAYRYLPDSVRHFPGPVELSERMTVAGFVNARFERFTGGIVALHLGDVA